LGGCSAGGPARFRVGRKTEKKLLEVEEPESKKRDKVGGPIYGPFAERRVGWGNGDR